jgi:putative ABC transport system permease protein
MMALFEQTIWTLWAHRLRSALAITAIAWGIVSVLVLLALGEGFYRVNVASFSLLMSNTQIVRPGQTSKPWQGLPARRAIIVNDGVLGVLKKQPDIQALSVVYQKWRVPVHNATGTPLEGYIRGVDPLYIGMKKIQLSDGSRNFTPYDVTQQSHVAILGWRIAQMGNFYLNQSVWINGIPFHIVGITQKKEGGVDMGFETRQILIPNSTFHSLWQGNPAQLMITPKPTITDAQLRTNLTSFFSRLMQFDPSDQYAMWMPDLSQGANFITALLRGIQMFLGGSGAMTLAVGALGVANIMFLSVTERTREIGVRLALGATPNSILRQFLVEGGVLVFIGTLVGLGLSYGVVYGLSLIGLPAWLGTPVITLDSLYLSLGVTIVLALLAAYFPARRAAHLTPVAALSARA